MEVGLIGSMEILEKAGWCRKFSNVIEEDEKAKKAQFEIHPIYSQDIPSEQVLNKILSLKVKLPTKEEEKILRGSLLKDLSIYTLFARREPVPGQYSFEYGMGFRLETTNLFLEDVLFKDVDQVSYKKKMGLFKEKVVTKEKKVMSGGELFGKEFSGDNTVVAVTGRVKDDKGQMKFGLRVTYNIESVAGGSNLVTDVSEPWGDTDAFFSHMIRISKLLEIIINKIYLMVGFSVSPEFIFLIGDVATDRSINNVQSKMLDDRILITNTQ